MSYCKIFEWMTLSLVTFQAPPKGFNNPYDPHNYDEYYAAEYGGFTASEGGGRGGASGGGGGGGGGGRGSRGGGMMSGGR